MMKNQLSELKQKRAAEIVRSLLTEGYIVTAHSDACGIYFLRHMRNQNKMRVEIGELGVYVFKNFQLKKIETCR